MSGDSPIQWTDATWNPVVGCTRVSAGCDHCYAFELHDKRHVAYKRGRWAAAAKQYHLPFSRVQLLPGRLQDPLRWRNPCRVFVNSMSDLFHDAVPDEFIAKVFGIMAMTPQHTYQVLTKRPERMLEWVTLHTHEHCAAWATGCLGELKPRTFHRAVESTGAGWPWPLPNVWLGVSVEDQTAADERIPLLLETPAAVRFLSCEPLLGRLDLAEYLADDAMVRALIHHQRTNHPCGGGGDRADCEVCGTEWVNGDVGLRWVIVGGESGRFARPMDLDWCDLLVQECHLAGIACFVKQLGSVWAGERKGRDGHGSVPEQWPEYLRVREWPASVKGRVSA